MDNLLLEFKEPWVQVVQERINEPPSCPGGWIGDCPGCGTLLSARPKIMVFETVGVCPPFFYVECPSCEMVFDAATI